jgi:acyl-CoA oxidase
MLLNKFADIAEDGSYISDISSDGKRFGHHMAALSGGRVLAASNAADISMCSVMTAIRFGAARQQFARKKNKPETYILDYPLHQARLFPIYARSYMEMISMYYMWEDYTKNSKVLMQADNKSGEYFHLLSSAMKSVFTWNSSESWKVSRLACGGLGFSALSNFHETGATADVNQTWEGENYVLIQQSCKLLLKNFSKVMQGKESMKVINSTF